MHANHGDLSNSTKSPLSMNFNAFVAREYFQSDRDEFYDYLVTDPNVNLVVSHTSQVLKSSNNSSTLHEAEITGFDNDIELQRYLLQFELLNGPNELELPPYFSIELDMDLDVMILHPSPTKPSNEYFRRNGFTSNRYYYHSANQVSLGEQFETLIIHPFSSQGSEDFFVEVQGEFNYLNAHVLNVDLSVDEQLEYQTNFTVDLSSQTINGDIEVEYRRNGIPNQISTLVNTAPNEYGIELDLTGGLWEYRFRNGTETEEIFGICSNGGWRSIFVFQDNQTETVCYGQCVSCESCLDLTEYLSLCADELQQIDESTYALSGAVVLNDVLHFNGDVIVDLSESSILGTTSIYLTDILNIDVLKLYEGEFNFQGQTASLEDVLLDNLNYYFEAGQIPIYIDDLTLIDSGVQIDGEMQFPRYFDNLTFEITQITITETGGIDLAGGIEVYDVGLRNGLATLDEMTLNFNTIEHKYSGNAQISTPIMGLGLGV
ncbi:MAG: hypothetical protein AAF193_06000, partial [Bacteroidota bacterium]